jgi:hypothetical protein
MNPSTTKTNQKHTPFWRCSEFVELDGAKEKATGFCGEIQLNIIINSLSGEGT